MIAFLRQITQTMKGSIMMMKKLTTFVVLALVFAVAFLSGGCDKRSPMESIQKEQSNALARGTFTADKTASGFYERQIHYQWCGGKSVTPDSMVIKEGECAQATYTLTADKILESDAVVYGVRGEICVHNNTDLPTTNFGLQDVVRYRSGGDIWHELVADSIDISAKPILQPGESFCYPYEVIFQPQIGAEYKNTAYARNDVSIIATLPVPFTLPDTQTLNEIDGEAQLTDAVFYPDGFTFSTSDPGPWYLTASDTITYTMQICNQSAACNNYFNFINIASLEKMTTHQIVADTAAAAIFTGECVDCGECDGGVTQLTLRYNGSHDAHIKVYQGRKVKPRMMIFDGNVAPNGTFTFNGTKEGGTMGGIISIYEGGHLKTIFHTSCEKPIGPGLIRGNFEVISGYSLEGGSLCSIDDNEFCDNGAKPKILTMRYTGQSCEYSHNSQDPEKTDCLGDPGYVPMVRIVACDKENFQNRRAIIWFDGMVELDAAFDISALNGGRTRLKGDTFVHILDTQNHLLQMVKFHTSCSQPLNQGDQFGSLVLEDFIPE